MKFNVDNYCKQGHETMSIRERSETSQFINLSNNELTHPKLDNILKSFGQKYDFTRASHYPVCGRLRHRIADEFAVRYEECLVTAGTDQAISEILSFLTQKNNPLVMQFPNFFNYENYATVNDVPIYRIPFLGLSNDELVAAFKQRLAGLKNAIVVVTTPHVYSGETLSSSVMEAIFLACQQGGHLFVIDEAYAAYSESHYLSYINRGYSGIIVLRSFSKAFGVAGMRIGCVFASESIIVVLKKIGILGCANDVAISLMNDLLDRYGEIKEINNDIKINREWTQKQLSMLLTNSVILSTSANFLTVHLPCVEEATSLTAYLKESNILVKHLSNIVGFERVIRVTIHDNGTMKVFIQNVKDWKAKTTKGCQYEAVKKIT